MTRWTKEDGSPKKGIYHSDLRSASPIVLKFTKGVVKSKYKNQMDFAPFNLLGDDTDYTYQVENEACDDAVRACPLGIWVTVTATGAKEDAALDIVVPAGYEPPEHATGVRAGHQNGGAAPQPARTAPRDGGPPPTVVDAYKLALRHAVGVRQWFVEQFGEDIDGVTKEIAATLLIQAERSNWRTPIGPDPESEPDHENGGELADLEMVEDLEQLIEDRAVPDEIEEKIRALIDNGITADRCERAMAYVGTFPQRDEGQDDLPF